MISILGIIFFCLILILGISYPLTANMYGHELAQEGTLDALSMFLFFTPVIFLLYLTGKHGFIAFQILYSVIVFAYLLSLHSRKKKSGILLLDIKSELWLAFLLVGLMNLGTTVSNTFLFFRHVSTGSLQGINLVVGLSGISFWGSLSAFWILLAFSKTEFRKNGVWIGIRFIKWKRIKSYQWEPSKPNILTITFKPDFPFFSGWMSLPIPTQYREDVSRILNERLLV